VANKQEKPLFAGRAGYQLHARLSRSVKEKAKKPASIEAGFDMLH
jgi:hypothetical protein